VKLCEYPTRISQERGGALEDYRLELRDMSRSQAYRLTEAAGLFRNLSPMGNVLPTACAQIFVSVPTLVSTGFVLGQAKAILGFRYTNRHASPSGLSLSSQFRSFFLATLPRRLGIGLSPQTQMAIPSHTLRSTIALLHFGWRFRQIVYVTPAQPSFNKFKTDVFPLHEH
jgi:hypothetical protein